MIQLIVNPVAGNGAAKTVGALAHEYLLQRGIEHEVRHTEYCGHATELAKDAALRGIQTVIAVGGDGTVSETGSGLMHTDCALGILAAGTGNDFLKALGLPSKWQPALEFILSHPSRPVDTGIINDRFFLNVCGSGFDVMVLDYALTAKKYMKGMLPYLYGVIRAIKNFSPAPMHIEIGDKVKLDGRYMICSVANGRFVGGGIPIAPVADVADGLFDIIVVDAVARWKIPFYLPGLLTGKLMNYKITHHYRAESVLLHSPGMRLNLDGEIVPVEQTRFTCQKDALRVHW
jgi:YegS/Rv2252/BmrU family lipid kinase